MSGFSVLPLDDVDDVAGEWRGDRGLLLHFYMYTLANEFYATSLSLTRSFAPVTLKRLKLTYSSRLIW